MLGLKSFRVNGWILGVKEVRVKGILELKDVRVQLGLKGFRVKEGQR